MIECFVCGTGWIMRKETGCEIIRFEDKHICTDCKSVKDDKNRAKYWNGPKNKAIRYYFYSQKGLALLNEARYLIMGVFALYYTLKLSNPFFLVLMFAVAIPVLLFLGWLSVNHIGKVIDWLNVEFATYWSRYQFTLQERQVKAMEEINAKIKDNFKGYV